MRRAATAEELELILQIGLKISLEDDLPGLLRSTVEGIERTLDTSSCAILLVEGGHLVIRAVTEYPDEIVGRTIPLGEGLTGRAAVSREEVLVSDLAHCPEYLHLGAGIFGSELDIPLLYRNRVLGVLNAQSARTDAFTERDRHLLRILGNHVAVALHNAQVRSELALVQDIGVRIATLMKPAELFAAIVGQIREQLHYDACAILQLEAGALVVRAASGQFPGEIVGRRVPLGEGITGLCATSRSVVNVGDVRAHPGYIASGIAEARSEIASPLVFQGELLGVLTMESEQEHAFDDDDARLLAILSGQVAVGVHNARTYAEAEALAVTDALTGLYNYRYFHERLGGEMSRSARYGHPLSLVMIDLDRFKQINDRRGHLKGDAVLKEVALTLKRNIRRYDETAILKDAEIDVASRYGGDEFIVIMPETATAGASVAAERVRRALASEVGRNAGLVEDDGGPWPITASLGVTAYQPGEEVETFVRRADEAAYEAKRAGRNAVFVR